LSPGTPFAVSSITEKVKGKVNETVGAATGDRAQQLKGVVQQGVGTVRKGIGDIEQDAQKNERRRP
jgi:uncharacterized protein YjbJ (UPF0337 family)